MRPEEETDLHNRSRSRCQLLNEDEIEITIYADDLSSLRAATNTWLRLVQIASEMIQISKNLNETNT